MEEGALVGEEVASYGFVRGLDSALSNFAGEIVEPRLPMVLHPTGQSPAPGGKRGERGGDISHSGLDGHGFHITSPLPHRTVHRLTSRKRRGPAANKDNIGRLGGDRYPKAWNHACIARTSQLTAITDIEYFPYRMPSTIPFYGLCRTQPASE